MADGTSRSLDFGRELIVDLFAGGGGASLGIEQAFGRSPDIAVNHDADALAMHEANHSATTHLRCDVFEVDPVEVTHGRQVGLLWASPDCKHFSKAKGSKPRSKKIRSIAWVVVKWAATVKPRVIMLENVEEFVTWGPLAANGQPCPKRKGSTFKRWAARLRNLGYTVEWRELRACDYGTPTIRKRFFLVARCDGRPIIWPAPTHGKPDSIEVRKGKRLPWRTAAECIDFSLRCPSIFLTKEEARAIGCKRPLAPATLRRIARGVDRFVLGAAKPFIVPVTHPGDARIYDIDDPARTITGANRGEQALVSPTLIQTGYGEREGQAPRAPGLDKPLGTAVAGGTKHAVVSAFLTKYRADNAGSGAETLHTVSAQGFHHAEVRAFMIAYYGNEKDGIACDEPSRTVVSRERFGLVTVGGTDYAIADIGLRMLTPRELFRAQGFPESYIIDRGVAGKKLPKDAQVRMCGNSVCPPMARALVSANLADLIAFYAKVAA